MVPKTPGKRVNETTNPKRGPGKGRMATWMVVMKLHIFSENL
jgi:hypothetical protein